ncbi:60S ribosomal protein L5 [Entomophthora muscae]|uniref:60S ribosomal protein L5 n=1 Tax=Entomophthora muscae TaxID=34485 RepID=A0ACC2TUT6_9FUNG|nr:60S ribosomal protein L5 [Entomophthora muscae]
MTFVKVVKNKAYFKRFQTKFRRRREGKTDYYARKKLVIQAKNKYNSPKYRLVGDFVLAAAYSHELPKYGIKCGLTNWTAAYATGLLVARRVLTKLNLADTYEGVTEPDGEVAMTEAVDDAPRPFKCFLDVGLARTSTGARVFGAMKGASDGGLYIPHSENRFPGYDASSKSLDTEVLREYIYGGHDDDEERFKAQFAKYLEEGIGADDLEDIYTNAYEKIREDPLHEKKGTKESRNLTFRKKRLTYVQRKHKIQQKIDHALRKAAQE